MENNNLPVDYYENPYTIKARLQKINTLATLAKLHVEADSAPGFDYPITGEELDALMTRAKEGAVGLYDALTTAFGVGMARHNK